MKAVVYALSSFQQQVMPGLWKDITTKIHHKVFENWISTTLRCLANESNIESCHHRHTLASCSWCRGSLEVPRLNYEASEDAPLIGLDAAAGDQAYAECASGAGRSAAWCRSVTVTFTVVLLLRHFIALVTVGAANQQQVSAPGGTAAVVYGGGSNGGGVPSPWQCKQVMATEVTFVLPSAPPKAASSSPGTEILSDEAGDGEEAEIDVVLEEAVELVDDCQPKASSYYRVGNFHVVQRVIDDSVLNWWVPDAVTYNTNIAGLFRSGNNEDAFWQLEIMVAKGLQLILNILLDYVAKDLDTWVAKEVLERCEELGFDVNVVNYSTVMDHFPRR
ncbi:hypothetical protein ZWY2020_011948 [Hordeum vulgare]|nr:hypothetical protein ZWY2020_011948 [Hordeum vulgare]